MKQLGANTLTPTKPVRFSQLDVVTGGQKLVRVIGHRGARGVMPENTSEGFAFTLRSGIDVLEFDVVLTRDGVPVITHNHRLSASATRTSSGAWLTGAEPKVASLTLAQLAEYDVGGLDGRTDYGQQYPDQAFLHDVRIPSLADLFRLTRKPGCENARFLLELKSDPDVRDDAEHQSALVSAVVADVRAHRMEPRTILHSFDWDLLTQCQRLAPDLPTSYLSQSAQSSAGAGNIKPRQSGCDFDPGGCIPDMVAKAGGQIWCPYYLDADKPDVDRAHALGLRVAVWTVNAPGDIERMIDLGVDAIVSDYPGRVQRHLLNRGLVWIDRSEKREFSD